MPAYFSNSDGIGGAIKSRPEDFVVEEIMPDGAVLELGKDISRGGPEGRYIHFIMEKKNWSTQSALAEIAKGLRTSQKAVNSAGMKDKVAVTTQLASVRSAPGISAGSLRSLRIRDISINGAWGASDRVRLGELLGNRFTITVREPCEDADERVEAIRAELGGKFPNYFGEQRFGSNRRNTHLVGEKLLQGDAEGAAIMFLCDSEGEKNELVSKLRVELRDSRDYAAALRDFPKHLRLERSMLAHLSNNPDDFIGAFRRLPRNILLLFVHAFQAHLFNTLLSERISEGAVELERGEYFCGESLGFPDIAKTEAEGWICGRMIGYGTMLNEREKRLLGELGVDKDSFRMRLLPEVASKGAHRTLFAPLKDFGFEAGACAFRFSLPSGSYATVAMREFTGTDK